MNAKKQSRQLLRIGLYLNNCLKVSGTLSCYRFHWCGHVHPAEGKPGELFAEHFSILYIGWFFKYFYSGLLFILLEEFNAKIKVALKNIISITMTKMKMIMTKMRILSMIAVLTMTNMWPRRPWWRRSCQRCGSRARSRSGTPPGRPLGMTNAYCLEQPVRLRQYHHHGHNRNHHYDYYNHYVIEKDNPREGPPLHRLRHFNSQNRHWQSL